jgi:predicted dehydrogenase
VGTLKSTFWAFNRCAGAERVVNVPYSGKPTLTAAVVGAGLMGGWHASAIRRAGGKVIAVVDPDRERAATLAKRFVGAQVYTRLDDALNQTRPAVVHLCTPTSTHRQQAEHALNAGAHLFVEKPLAPTLQDTQDIFTLAEQKGLAVCPVHQFIFQDGFQRVQAWLPKAGEILQISFTIHSAGGVNLAPPDLNTLVGDILPHPLSLLQAMLPGSLESHWNVSRPAPGEFRAFGTHIGRSPTEGVGLAIEISLNARPTRNSLSVAAKNATLNADLFHGFAFRLPGNVSRTQKIIQPFEISLRQFGAAAGNLILRLLNAEGAYPGLRRLVYLFYEALRSGGIPPIPVHDTIAVAHARQVILAN